MAQKAYQIKGPKKKEEKEDENSYA